MAEAGKRLRQNMGVMRSKNPSYIMLYRVAKTLVWEYIEECNLNRNKK